MQSAVGCFQDILGFSPEVGFPTRVGVFLSRPPPRLVRLRLPHPRGGVSGYYGQIKAAMASFPTYWGVLTFDKLGKVIEVTTISSITRHFNVKLSTSHWLGHIGQFSLKSLHGH